MPIRIKPARPPYPSAVQSRLDQIMPPGLEPLALFQILAIDPRLFERFMAGSLLDAGNLPLRHREVIIGRTTAKSQCEYERAIHAMLFGKAAGFAAEHIDSMANGGPSDACWSNEEALLLRATDSLCLSCDIDDDLWSDLNGCFTDAALVEVILLVGFYRTVSCLANSLRLPPEPWISPNEAAR